MGYNQDSDKLLRLFEKTNEDGNSFLISIFSYNGAAPKIQITRMFKKKDGTMGYGKMGRLSAEEFQFILNNSSEILEIMKNGG